MNLPTDTDSTFSTCPDLSDDDGPFSLTRQGTVRVNMLFAAALANTVTVIIYGEFENIIEIGRLRNIVFDFTN